MRKFSGITLIVFSSVMAFTALTMFKENAIESVIMLLLICLPVYMAGHLIRTSKKKMKESWKLWLSIFVFCFMIVPGLFITDGMYYESKEKTFVDEGYILFELASSHNLNGLSIIFIMILLLTISMRFFSEDVKEKGKGIANAVIIGTLVAYGSYLYVTWSDYRAVHQEKGLITHKWNGEAEVIPYNEIKQMTIRPYIDYASISDPTDETNFAWRLYFLSKNDKETMYQFVGLNEGDLEKAKRIQRLSNEKEIPFRIIQMNDKERKEFDFQLELHEVEKQPFYDFFVGGE